MCKEFQENQERAMSFQSSSQSDSIEDDTEKEEI